MSRENTCGLLIEAVILFRIQQLWLLLSIYTRSERVVPFCITTTTSVREAPPCCGKSRLAPDVVNKAEYEDA